MRPQRLLVAVAVSGAAALAAPLVTASAATPDPAGTIPVTSGPSVFTDSEGAAVGSSQFAVLGIGHQGAGRPPDWQYGELVARAADGAVTEVAGAQYDLNRYSLVGDTLSSEVGDDAGQVDWWNLTAGTHGRVTLPVGEEYLTGAPDGFLVRDGERLVRRSTTGTVTDVGSPPPGSSTFSATAGDGGVVVSGGTAGHPVLSYQAFDAPGSFTTLDLPGATSAQCLTVAGGYAGCWVDSATRVALVPVDGVRPATVVSAIDTAPGYPLQLAVAGSTLLWQRDDGTSPVHSVGYGSTTVRSSTAVSYPVSAYGAALATSTATPGVVRITSATSTPTLVLAPGASPVSATALSLSPGLLVDNDDRRTRSSSAATTSTFSTQVSTSSPTLRVGAAAAVHRGTFPSVVAGSGTTTVYAPAVTLPDTRIVRTPRGMTTLRHVAGDRWFDGWQATTSLSGNRLVYAVEASDHRSLSAYVFDASTGRRTLVQRDAGFALPVVTGTSVSSIHGDGSVWRRNLVTGDRVEVSPPVTFPVDGAALHAWGDYVGWSVAGRDAGDQDFESYGYRNAATLAPTVRVHVTSLTSAGAVLVTRSVVDGQEADTYSLRTYGGPTVPLLPQGQYAASPQVEGRTVAWIDSGGRVKVAPVAVSLAAPRFLGAPLAPAGISTPGRAGWRVYAPFSAPLTACRADLLRGSRVVRRLACDAARMRVGVAEFAWDGTYGGHRAPAGTYRWRIVSAGDGGASSNENGDARPVTHAVAVGRPTRVVLRSPARVTRGSSAVLSAHLTTTPRSRDRHRDLSFYRRLAGGAWHRVATVTTSRVGTARLRVRPATTAVYRAAFSGSPLDRPSTSAARRVRVHR